MHTVYGKTFQWGNFHGWYANDYSRENFCSCLLLHVASLHESYRITYSAKIRRKIIMQNYENYKSFPTRKFCRTRYRKWGKFHLANFHGFRGFSENRKSFSCESFALSINIVYIVTTKIHILWIPQNFSPVKVSLFTVY